MSQYVLFRYTYVTVSRLRETQCGNPRLQGGSGLRGSVHKWTEPWLANPPSADGGFVDQLAHLATLAVQTGRLVVWNDRQ
jgi:hypothetical protein